MSSVRSTSAEAYKAIKENGLLKGRQLEVYMALYEIGASTGSELFYHMSKSRNPTHSNVTTRLGELRDMGVVKEVGQRQCSITKRDVILWEVTTNLPIKLEKVSKVKCKACNGKGYHSKSVQSKLF